MINIKKFILGPIQANCYLVYNEQKQGFVIDPGDVSEELAQFIKDKDIELKYVLLTHGHIDHIAGVAALKKEFVEAQVCLHAGDQETITWSCQRAEMFGYECQVFKPDVLLEGEQELGVGDIVIQVLHTPGHSPGGVCFYLKKEHLIFTGDTLFKNAYGRTDLPGADWEEMRQSLQRLFRLLGETRVLPGHGDETDIGREMVNYI